MLLEIAKNGKLGWLGNVVRAKETVANTSLQGKVERKHNEEGQQDIVGRCKGMDRAKLD